MGHPGMQGVAGNPGPEGPRGVQGPQGSTGPMGAPGPAGMNGQNGPQVFDRPSKQNTPFSWPVLMSLTLTFTSFSRSGVVFFRLLDFTRGI